MELLQALNLGRSALGLDAVSSLDTADPDVADWDKHYTEAKREVLQYGWPFNTDWLTLSPTANKIAVSSYIKVPVLSELGLTVRNGYVWDSKNASYYNVSLGKTPVVVDVAWTDIPHEFQEWIAYKAAVKYIHQVKGAVNSYLIYKRLEAEAMGQAERLYPVDYGKGTGSNRIAQERNR